MSKEEYLVGPTPPPFYRTPSLSERFRPQHTGSSKPPYEHELNDMHSHRHMQPQDYDDGCQRWRRGVENDMPQRPRQRSNIGNIFATCCCSSIWGIAAWVVGLTLLVGGFTALLVKTMLPHAATPSVSNPTTSTVTVLPASTTASYENVSTTTITTSSPQPSITTTTSVSTYTPPQASTVTITTSSPTPIVITSIGTVTDTSASFSTVTTTMTNTLTTTSVSLATSVTTVTLKLKTSDPQTATLTRVTASETASRSSPSTPVTTSHTSSADGEVKSSSSDGSLGPSGTTTHSTISPSTMLITTSLDSESTKIVTVFGYSTVLTIIDSTEPSTTSITADSTGSSTALPISSSTAAISTSSQDPSMSMITLVISSIPATAPSNQATNYPTTPPPKILKSSQASSPPPTSHSNSKSTITLSGFTIPLGRSIPTYREPISSINSNTGASVISSTTSYGVPISISQLDSIFSPPPLSHVSSTRVSVPGGATSMSTSISIPACYVGSVWYCLVPP